MACQLHVPARLNRHLDYRPCSYEQICGLLDRWCAGGSEFARCILNRPGRKNKLETVPGYFVWGDVTRFCVPLPRIEPVPASNPDVAPRWHRHTALVRRLRCFRCLGKPDSPPDLTKDRDGKYPSARLEDELARIGVVSRPDFRSRQGTQ